MSFPHFSLCSGIYATEYVFFLSPAIPLDFPHWRHLVELQSSLNNLGNSI